MTNAVLTLTPNNAPVGRLQNDKTSPRWFNRSLRIVCHELVNADLLEARERVRPVADTGGALQPVSRVNCLAEHLCLAPRSLGLTHKIHDVNTVPYLGSVAFVETSIIETD